MNGVRFAGAVAIGAMVGLAGPALAHETGAAHDHAHDHGHDHNHAHDPGQADPLISKGYFEDSQIGARDLSDWAGDWQSVYPLLVDGTLDQIMAHKAEHGDKTADEYRAYYDIGYKTDVYRITIDGATVTFYQGDTSAAGEYATDGQEILTYAKGNRGVRFIFEKQSGDADAPQFIQFSDHIIAPQKSDHFHLYWGDDRAALLEEVTNWPTYYPSTLTADQIVAEMQAH